MRASRSLPCLVLVLLLGDIGPADGHGSWWPPPPERRPGRDLPGPGTGSDSGPSTPGPTTPGPTSPPFRQPPTGGAVTPPSGGGPGAGPTTAGGGRKRRASASIDGWEVWWEYNKDPYLRWGVRGNTRSGGAAFLTGHGRREAADGFAAPTADETRGDIVPALVRALSTRDAEILDSATIALGRVAAPEIDGVAGSLREQMKSPHATVRQSGLLALGILGDRASAPLLWQVMSDTRDGRAALGGSATAVERAFAAFALGFSCGPEMVPQLVRLIERTRGDDVEVVAGAVLTLGLVPEAATTTVPFLASLLDDRKLDRRIRAQVPIALARLGSSAAPLLPRLLELATDRRTDDDVRRSSVIAIGRLAAIEDTEVVTRLRLIVRKESDAALRHFTLVALGRILSRSPSDDAGKRIHDLLALELADPSYSVDLPWTALALGLAGHGLPVGSELRQSLCRSLASLFRSTRNPSEVGAVAIALGLAGATEAGSDVLDRFEQTNDPGLRARLAVALGLVGHRPAAETLTEAMFLQKDSALRVELATGLRLLGDARASASLVDAMRNAPTFAVAAAAGRALGQVGDRRVVAPLIALLDDRDQSEPVRAFSAVALGLIAEKTNEPWNAPLSVDSNYLAGLDVQRSVLDIY